MMNKTIPKNLLTVTLLLVFNSFLSAQTDVQSLYFGSYRINDIAFSADNKFLSVQSGDTTALNGKTVLSPSLQVLEVETGSKTISVGSEGQHKAFCFSNDGNLFAFKDGNNIKVVNVNTKKILNVIEAHDNLREKEIPWTFSNEGKYLMLKFADTYSIYDLDNSQLIRKINSDAPPRVSADDKFLMRVYNNRFTLADFTNDKELHSFFCGDKKKGGKGKEIRNVVFSPDSKFAAILCDNKIKILSFLNFEIIQTIPVNAKDQIFEFSKDERYIAGGSDTLKMWELKTGREIYTPLTTERKKLPITVARFSPNGKMLAIGAANGVVKIWNLTDKNVSAYYYAKEIKQDIKNLPAKREFERTDEYNKRLEKQSIAVGNKYMQVYGEKVLSERGLLENLASVYEKEQEILKKKIIASVQTVNLKVDSIGLYDADRETFTLKVVDPENGAWKIAKVKVPREENASCFKQNYQSLGVTGTRQLMGDGQQYDVFNIKISSNCPGKLVEYPFGVQRKPLFIE